jgi:hypothetical protein
MEICRTHRIDGVERSHAMIGLVPALVPFSGVDREQHIRPDLANNRGGLFS